MLEVIDDGGLGVSGADPGVLRRSRRRGQWLGPQMSAPERRVQHVISQRRRRGSIADRTGRAHLPDLDAALSRTDVERRRRHIAQRTARQLARDPRLGISRITVVDERGIYVVESFDAPRAQEETADRHVVWLKLRWLLCHLPIVPLVIERLQ